MSEVIIHGLPMSSYVRTTLMMCTFKSINHTLQPLEPGSNEHMRLHPFGRVPAMQHGSVRLFETLAIDSYLDATFDGPPMLAEDIYQRAITLQWVSAINDYIYKNLILRCASERFVKPMFGKEPDEDAIQAAMPDICTNLDALDYALTSEPYFSGKEISMADLFLAPILNYFAATPEGQAELPSRKNLTRWHELISKLPGYTEINKLG